MPIVDERHDRAHVVEADAAWSESFYFNGFDPGSDAGFFTRIGVRPNEGTMDVGFSVWLPGGGLAEYRASRPEHAAPDALLEVGAVRYEMLEAGRAWRLVMDADLPVRPTGSGAPGATTVHTALDLRFDALTPAIGTDGTGRTARSAEAAAAAGTVGKGHFEQAGAWSGSLELDGQLVRWRDALGNRDRSWGPRRWGGPRMWRWFSLNLGADLHLGGIRLATDAGELHRGWIYDRGRTTSVAQWLVRTELDGDNRTQRVVHLEVLDKADRRYALRGDVLRVAELGRAGGTLINEGLARWGCRTPDGRERTGYGICEYLHQLDAEGRPQVPIE